MKAFMMICVLFIMLINPAFAQSFKDDMNKLERAFSNQHMQFDLTQDVYPSHSSGTKIQSVRTSYFVWDDMFLYKTKEIEVLTNDRLTLSINHDRKTLLLNKNNPARNKQKLQEFTRLFSDSVKKQI